MLALPHVFKRLFARKPARRDADRCPRKPDASTANRPRMIREFLDWYHRRARIGRLSARRALLMALESSVVPLPSEVVIPPAAHLAYTRGDMTLTGIVIAGTIGSWIGATVMYWGARLLGRPLVMRYGRYVLIGPDKIAAAEAWSDRFGAPGVFVSRLLPVIRHLIGLPAGIVRMHYGWYSRCDARGFGDLVRRCCAGSASPRVRTKR